MALDVLGEPLVKLFMGIKQRRHDEVQQGPQLREGNTTRPSTRLSCSHARTDTRTQTTHLSHGVLDRCSREQQPVSTLKLQQDFPPNAEMTEMICECKELIVYYFQFLRNITEICVFGVLA